MGNIIDKYGKLLVDYSLGLGKGGRLLVMGGYLAEDPGEISGLCIFGMFSVRRRSGD